MNASTVSISCDKPVETLSEVFGNIELATESLFHLRDRLLADGNPVFSDASVVLGLYLQYVDQLLRKGRKLAYAGGEELTSDDSGVRHDKF